MLRLKRVREPIRIDLQTVRETLTYIRDDVSAEPDLANVASALEKAIREIDAAAAPKERLGPSNTPVAARFFASRS